VDITVDTTSLDEVKIIIPDQFKDDRGYFMEVYRSDIFHNYGLPTNFVQMNKSSSIFGVMRGLHLQWDPPMDKLIWASRGSAFLVAVDVKKSSNTFGEYVSVISNFDNRKMLYAPAHFARGAVALSDDTEIEYLATGIYNSSCETTIRWDDPRIGIDWPGDNFIISERDKNAQTLTEWENFTTVNNIFI
jgi:dTDP-4-dehydrorhamnose 3,5-epimerase